MPAELQFYKFSQFRVDQRNRVLLHAGRRVKLTPKMFDLLLFLVENAGKTLSHDDIFSHVWAHAFVTDAVLVQNIASLRRILKIEPGSEKSIETIPKHGYRFTAAVEVGEELHSHDPRLSIAILPLIYTTKDDPDYSVMSVGIADALCQRLGRLSTITVRPVSSVLHMHKPGTEFCNCGHRLGVDFVLTVQLISGGSFVSVMVKLLQVNNQQFIWQQNFKLTRENLLLIEDKIVGQVGRLMTDPRAGASPELPHSPTRNSDAYHNYLKGRFFWNRRNASDLYKAIECFEAAIKLDDNFGLAYTGLCDSYTMLITYGMIAPRIAIPRARHAAIEAMRLGPDLSESHASLGYVHAAFDWNWLACEEEFRTAVELNPNNVAARYWLATLYVVLKQHEKSLSVIDEAREVDPLSPMLGSSLGLILYLMARFGQAESELRKVLELRPNYAPALLYLGHVLGMQGRFDDALNAFEQAHGCYQTTFTRAAVAQALVLCGRTADGLKVLNELIEKRQQEYVSPYALAFVYESLGDQQRVFDMLTEAFHEKSISMQWFGIDPRFAEIHKTDFGKRLLQLTNHLPDASIRASGQNVGTLMP
jgi:DNA-binding winged helix-turn-helix (wHTH) protein/tetratricopeptide (TPR) repeat protein